MISNNAMEDTKINSVRSLSHLNLGCNSCTLTLSDLLEIAFPIADNKKAILIKMIKSIKKSKTDTSFIIYYKKEKKEKKENKI
jgi:hypothetical protein